MNSINTLLHEMRATWILTSNLPQHSTLNPESTQDKLEKIEDDEIVILLDHGSKLSNSLIDDLMVNNYDRIISILIDPDTSFYSDSTLTTTSKLNNKPSAKNNSETIDDNHSDISDTPSLSLELNNYSLTP